MLERVLETGVREMRAGERVRKGKRNRVQRSWQRKRVLRREEEPRRREREQWRRGWRLCLNSAHLAMGPTAGTCLRRHGKGRACCGRQHRSRGWEVGRHARASGDRGDFAYHKENHNVARWLERPNPRAKASL